MVGRVDLQIIEGNSGEMYPFQCHRANDPFKTFPKFSDDSGIYGFADLSHIDENGWTVPKVLYVGESHSFEERVIESHEKWNDAFDLNATHICILKLENSSESERKDIERDIYLKHAPPCNDKSP
ncbi:MAG: hypothetical protein OXM61_16915 [Candidatus Poribacteria bacterium]|nr:hypothetical protein [Candidatus Poribacteria bacterium]